MSDPTISVIVPAYNRLGHLQSAVASVLAQTCADFELLIADDGSAEPTRAWLAQLADARVRVLTLPHTANPAIARNAAIRVARGHYVAFLDSDDVWTSDKLARQSALMAERGCGWSYTQCGRIDADGRAASWSGVLPWRAFEGDIVEPLLTMHALIALPTVMAERALIESVGGFDEQQRFAEDYDLWLRLALRAKVCAFADRLTMVRVHTDNFSQDRLGAHLGWLQLYGKMIELVPGAHLRRVCRRRRAAAGLTVAAIQARSGQKRMALRTLAQSARDGWTDPRWWPRAARASVRLILPARRTPH